MGRAEIFNMFFLAIKKVILFVVFFLYLFSIQFSFVPGYVGTRAILGILGIIVAIIIYRDSLFSMLVYRECKIKLSTLFIAFSLCLIVLNSVFTNLLNGTSEWNFIFYPISMIMIFGGAFLLYLLAKITYGYVDFYIIAKYFIAITFFQVLISVVMLFVPALKVLLAEFIYFDEIALYEILNEDGFRLMGLGVQFFAAGIVNSFALILIAEVLVKKRCNFKLSIYYVTAFLAISAFGMMMSRTTLIGIVLALSMFILHFRQYRNNINLRYIFSVLLMILFSSLLVFMFLSEDTKELLEVTYEYGFELFVNYFEEGEASTDSTDELIEMFDIVPSDTYTWIFGDGYFKDPSDPSFYYMNTDVGYSRLIFYGGLIGLMFYILYQISLFYKFNEQTNGEYVCFILFVAIFMFIGNVKGLTDMTTLIAPFLYLSNSYIHLKDD